MKIGVIGSGDVGRRLADGLLDLGHEVKIGTRDTSKKEVVEWIDKHRKKGERESAANAYIGSFAEAASFGDDLIIISTAWSGTPNAIEMAGPDNMKNKIVIDTTNPLDFSQGLPPKMAVGHTGSAAETVQRLLPQAKVIKAFNIVGNPHMVHPDFPGGPPTMFICGNDEQAKKMVIDNILTPFGWETIDIGGLEGARLLEPLALLWITYYFRTGTGNHAFKLLKK
ncbi:MAG TPA: NAD(P)-binding domain-containing protein [Nitrososphaeraceae archaeon]|nr:NAD(P)-binding domain-containing protein [Nitrososphaeraceae archaeon]